MSLKIQINSGKFDIAEIGNTRFELCEYLFDILFGFIGIRNNLSDYLTTSYVLVAFVSARNLGVGVLTSRTVENFKKAVFGCKSDQ